MLRLGRNGLDTSELAPRFEPDKEFLFTADMTELDGRHWNSVCSSKQLGVLRKIATTVISQGFYMAGGTALAARLGHRMSEDFDFFREKNFNPESLVALLGEISHLEMARNTVNCLVDGIRIQFLGFPYPLLENLDSGLFEVPIAGIADIALMKFSAAMARGSKKDFIDLRAIASLPEYDLSTLLEMLPKKFPSMSEESSVLHLVKSLTYFTDAEHEPDPTVLDESWQWEETKAFFRQAVSNLARQRLRR